MSEPPSFEELVTDDPMRMIHFRLQALAQGHVDIARPLDAGVPPRSRTRRRAGRVAARLKEAAARATGFHPGRMQLHLDELTQLFAAHHDAVLRRLEDIERRLNDRTS